MIQRPHVCRPNTGVLAIKCAWQVLGATPTAVLWPSLALGFALCTGALPVAAESPADDAGVMRLDQNWNEGWKIGEADWFHHASQGTMILPYDWFMSLEQPSATQPRALFSNIDYLCKTFGFIPSKSESAYNPDGLPIGFAIAYDFRDPRKRVNGELPAPMPVVGFTCAACHTAEIHYDDRRILIEGGQAMIDLGSFSEQLSRALFITNSSATKFDAFARRVGDRYVARRLAQLRRSGFSDEQIQAAMSQLLGSEALLKSQLKSALEQAVLSGLRQRELETKLGLNNVKAGFSRTDALSRIGNRLFGELNPLNHTETDAPVNFPPIWDTPWFNWVQYNASIRLPMVRNIGQTLGVGAAIDVLGSPEHRFDSTVDIANLHEMEQQIAGPSPFQGLRSPKWPAEILGEIEGLSEGNGKWAAGRELYNAHCLHCHYRIEDYRAQLENPDLDTHWTSSNVYGRRFMKLPTVNFFDLGTDNTHVLQFYRRVVYSRWHEEESSRTMSALEGLATVTGAVRERKYKELGLDDETMNRYDGYRELAPEPAAVARLAYKARPLNGIWATAPYLHNGSVPNLYEMLLPAKQRSKTFNVGSKEFDATKVGFRTNWKENTFLFDTSLTGNSNAGHEFRDLTAEEEAALSPSQKDELSRDPGTAVFGRVGPLLDDNDRWALIEYLKSL